MPPSKGVGKATECLHNFPMPDEAIRDTLKIGTVHGNLFRSRLPSVGRPAHKVVLDPFAAVPVSPPDCLLPASLPGPASLPIPVSLFRPPSLVPYPPFLLIPPLIVDEAAAHSLFVLPFAAAAVFCPAASLRAPTTRTPAHPPPHVPIRRAGPPIPPLARGQRDSGWKQASGGRRTAPCLSRHAHQGVPAAAAHDAGGGTSCPGKGGFGEGLVFGFFITVWLSPLPACRRQRLPPLLPLSRPQSPERPRGAVWRGSAACV